MHQSESLSPELQLLVNNAKNDLLPEKSKNRYKIAYKNFVDWKKEKEISISSEDCLLLYFDQVIVKKYAPNSSWSYYSMLKSLIKIKENIDISKFNSLSAKLKKYAKNYEPKKADTFTSEEIQYFLEEAPDVGYLAHKVISTLFISYSKIFEVLA